MARFVYSAGAAAASSLVLVKEYDFTSCTNIDISANGTHNVLQADGSTALASIITSTDAGSGAITGTNNVDVTSGSGIVLDVTSGGGAENTILAVALPTDLKDEFDQCLLMFEWLIDSVAMTGTNSLAKFAVSTASSARGTPSNGMTVIKSASGYDLKGERQYNASVARTSADTSTFTGGTIHVQFIMRRMSGVVYMDTGTAFADPYTLSTTFGLGTRAFNATRPVGATQAPQWTAPHAAITAYCNTTANAVAFTVKKFRICKFSPSVS
jgi:hypothetical protein